MNDIAQDRLHDIIKNNGIDLIRHPDRCEGLLRDYCAEYRLEVSVLVTALKERVPNELLKPVSGVPRDVQLGMLARRLEDNNGFTETVASWAVDAWAVALDQPPSSKKSAPKQALLPTPAPVPVPLPDPSPVPVPSPVTAWAGPVVALALLAGIAFAGYKVWDKYIPHGGDQAQTQTDGPTGPEQSGDGKSSTASGDTNNSPAGNGGTNKAPSAANGETKLPGSGSGGANTAGAGDKATAEGPANSNGGKQTTSAGDVRGPVTLPAGTDLSVRMNDGISSESARVGETFIATLDKAVALKGGQGSTVLPKGTEVTVRVTTADKVGRTQGAAALGLRVVSLSLHDQTIRVSTATWLVKGQPRGKGTGKLAGIAGAIGAGIGAIAGGAKGAVAGGAAGAGSAVAYRQLKPGDPIQVQPEAILRVRLNEPLEIEL